MKVLIFVAFFATTIFAETPVGRQRYFVAQPSSGQSAPYAPRGWKPDGPSFDLPGRQNQPSVNVRYPQNIGPVDQQQRQQPSSQFGPFEIEIDLAPAIPADSPRVNVQPQVQSQYREPSRVYGAPSQQFPDPRETYGPPVQRPNINFDNQYGVPAQGRFNVPNNQQFAPAPQQELTPPSLSNPNVFNPARAQQPSKLSNPTNLYDAPKQSQYIPPNFDHQYDVPVNQFDSPNKQSPYQSSATNVQEFNTPTKQPFGVNNANENEYRAPAKQHFGVGPNIQDQFNEPGQDEFGVQHPQTSNREPKFENDQRNTSPRNPSAVPNQYPLNENNVPVNPNNSFGPRNPSYNFGSRIPQNNFGQSSPRNPVENQNPQNRFGNNNGQYPRVPDSRYGAPPPNQYQTPRFGIPNPESNNFNSPRPQYKDEELTTTEESTSTEEIESTTVGGALAQSESEEANTSDEFSDEVEDTEKPSQSTRLAKPQRGEYYVSLPDGRLQRVRYISQQDIEAMRYFAKIRAENVEPLRGPIYAYAPLQEIKIGSESIPSESLSVSASELKPQSTNIDGVKVNAIKPLAQVQYQLDNPAGFLLPLTSSYSTFSANYANSPNEERLIVAIP
ncbi:hypothetical protein TKK_0016327 [Trichogramma kaykai]